MILICYDGSEDAKAAIQHLGELASGQRAVVLTVWQPVLMMATHTPTAFMFLPTLLDSEEIDKANADHARGRAEEGTELARTAGLDVGEPLVLEQVSTVADAILAEAERLGAEAILMGSRGLTGLRSLLLGSVSHAVLQHADRPVIVVPSSKVARSRTRLRAAVGNEQNLNKRT